MGTWEGLKVSMSVKAVRAEGQTYLTVRVMHGGLAGMDALMCAHCKILGSDVATLQHAPSCLVPLAEACKAAAQGEG